MRKITDMKDLKKFEIHGTNEILVHGITIPDCVRIPDSIFINDSEHIRYNFLFGPSFWGVWFKIHVKENSPL